MNMHQALPVPVVHDVDGCRIEIGDTVFTVLSTYPDFIDVVGEVIKVSHDGDFIYVRLEGRLLPESDRPEILIAPPALFIRRDS